MDLAVHAAVLATLSALSALSGFLLAALMLLTGLSLSALLLLAGLALPTLLQITLLCCLRGSCCSFAMSTCSINFGSPRTTRR
jgi:hypothetical protein